MCVCVCMCAFPNSWPTMAERLGHMLLSVSSVFDVVTLLQKLSGAIFIYSSRLSLSLSHNPLFLSLSLTLSLFFSLFLFKFLKQTLSLYLFFSLLLCLCLCLSLCFSLCLSITHTHMHTRRHRYNSPWTLWSARHTYIHTYIYIYIYIYIYECPFALRWRYISYLQFERSTCNMRCKQRRFRCKRLNCPVYTSY